MRRITVLVQDAWMIVLHIAVLYLSFLGIVVGTASIARHGSGFPPVVMGVCGILWVTFSMGSRARSGKRL